MSVWLDPRNGPEFDCPVERGPSQRYVVASVPRSGSTLLCRLLWDIGCVGAPKEYLNPMQLRDWECRMGSPLSQRFHSQVKGQWVGALVGRGWSAARIRQHLQRVSARRTSGGWFGLKLHRHHFLRFCGPADAGGLLGQPVWIRIQRRDRLGQAISWARALQTDRWASWQTEVRAPRYQRALVASRLAAIADAEAGWDDYLRGRRCLSLAYEDLVTDPENTLRSVLRYLEVPDADDRSVPRPESQRQADGVNDEWRHRWMRDASSRRPVP